MLLLVLVLVMVGVGVGVVLFAAYQSGVVVDRGLCADQGQHGRNAHEQRGEPGHSHGLVLLLFIEGGDMRFGICLLGGRCLSLCVIGSLCYASVRACLCIRVWRERGWKECQFSRGTSAGRTIVCERVLLRME